jgi:hypothetical protein
VVGDAVLLSPDAVGTTLHRAQVTAVTASTPDTPQQLTFAPAAAAQRRDFTTNPTYSDSGGGVTLLGQLSWQRYRMNGHRPGARAAAGRHQRRAGAQRDGLPRAVRRVVDRGHQQDAGEPGSTPPAPSRRWTPPASPGCVRCASAWWCAARSARRPTPAGVCEASLAKPQLFGAEVEPDVSDWACYRFRSAVLVIPLRNLVLGIKT